MAGCELPIHTGCWPLSVLVICEDTELTAGELESSLPGICDGDTGDANGVIWSMFFWRPNCCLGTGDSEVSARIGLVFSFGIESDLKEFKIAFLIVVFPQQSTRCFLTDHFERTCVNAEYSLPQPGRWLDRKTWKICYRQCSRVERSWLCRLSSMISMPEEEVSIGNLVVP